MNPFFASTYQLYLLQIENYELGRFYNLLFRRGLFKKQTLRKDLVWTNKARLFFVLATTLNLMLPVIAIKDLAFPVAAKILILISLLLALNYFHFVFFTIIWVLVYPVDFVAKKFVVMQAKAKLKQFPDLKVIGVAGSYGKTTMKEMLKTVLGAQYSVLSTPESVNTPVGISRFILKKVSNETQILIMEMGEHYKGDVKEICDLIKPDVAVITGINESHLERMGDLNKIIETIFEVAQNSKPEATIYINADDKNIAENFSAMIPQGIKVESYSRKNILAAEFDQNNLGWNLSVNSIGQLHIKLLGEYVLGNVDAVIKMALSFNIEASKIKKAIETIVPVSHRLEPIRSAGEVLIIDDAYNGNPEGVKEAIKLLSRFTNRRKVYITPGLVEMGDASEAIHLEVGKELAEVADVVVLIKNSVTGYIAEGLEWASKTTNYPLPTTHYFNTAQEAHSSLGKILQPYDVVIFQNDWGDNYV